MNVARRRVLQTLAAGALAAGVTLRARGQAMRRIGVLYPGTKDDAQRRFDAVWKELGELGFVEGRNLRVARRNDLDSLRYPSLVAELVGGNPDAILTEGTQTTRLLQRATRTIPIVTGVGDPVGSGFAKSLAKPGMNITGLSWGNPEKGVKVVELVQAYLPDFSALVVMIDASNAASQDLTGPLERAARERKIDVRVVPVREAGEIEAELRNLKGAGRAAFFEGALGAGDSATMRSITEVAIRHRVPFFSHYLDWARNGGLASLAFVHSQHQRRLANILATILRGGKVANMPFLTPDGSLLTVNKATAAAIGLKIPIAVLTAATEVIA